MLLFIYSKVVVGECTDQSLINQLQNDQSSRFVLSCCVLRNESSRVDHLCIFCSDYFTPFRSKQKPRAVYTQLTDCQVHVVPFSERSEPVQTAALVVVLQELDEAFEESREQKDEPLN